MTLVEEFPAWLKDLKLMFHEFNRRFTQSDNTFLRNEFSQFLSKSSWYSLFEFQLASIKCWVVFPIISLFVYTPQFSTVVFGFKHVQLRKIFDLRKFSLFPKWKNNLHNVWFKQDFQFKQDFNLPKMKDFCYSRQLP